MRRSILALSLLAAPAFAQDPDPAHLLRDLFVPLHTCETAGYGTWAACERYKAGFDDGFRLVPYLGAEQPENLSFAWATESVLSVLTNAFR